jgi:regulator of sigma E protease
MVVLGLGFVIFIHELGHFALAKWADVKVEKFSIGFGPTLIGFRRGETQYSISAIPLGGFVKMLGENPEQDGQEATTDPRSYLNKTVGQRMAIISAGVIMNIITAVGFFALAYRFGMTFTPAIVGLVAPGSPAYDAGMQPGDEIVSIDDMNAPSFEDLLRKVSTSSSGQVVRLGIKRPETAEPITVDVAPVLKPGRLKPEVGILTAGDLILGLPKLQETAGLADGAQISGDARAGDRIVAVAPADGDWVEVDSERELLVQLSKYRSQPVRLRLVASEGADTAPREVTVPAVAKVGLGIRFELGPITAVAPGSPAALAGIKPGDRLVEVDGKPVDIRTLPGIALDHAGKSLKLTVADESGQKRDVQVTPRADAIDRSLGYMTDLVDVAPLGLSVFVMPKVASVDAGSAAEKAGVTPEAIVTKVRLAMPETPGAPQENFLGGFVSSLWTKFVQSINPDYTKPDPNSFALKMTVDEQPASDGQTTSVNMLMGDLNFGKAKQVSITLAGREGPIEITPTTEPGAFLADRGLIRLGMLRPLPPQPFGVAISRGFDDAQRGVGEIFRTLRALITQRVSRKLLGGPVTIAQAAHASASEGLGQLMNFLGMLSINLAVLNFLPIAPLDGGQMVLLMGEKIRGKPLPERLQVVYTLLGLSFVLGLMFMVLSQDLLRVFGFM